MVTRRRELRGDAIEGITVFRDHAGCYTMKLEPEIKAMVDKGG
jgi:hypothetical protein